MKFERNDTCDVMSDSSARNRNPLVLRLSKSILPKFSLEIQRKRKAISFKCALGLRRMTYPHLITLHAIGSAAFGFSNGSNARVFRLAKKKNDRRIRGGAPSARTRSRDAARFPKFEIRREREHARACGHLKYPIFPNGKAIKTESPVKSEPAISFNGRRNCVSRQL